MTLETHNILRGLAAGAAAEVHERLAAGRAFRLDRIVSTGQATPPGDWYDQAEDEWVMLVAGEAGLRIEGEAAPRILGAGDWLHLPARCRHRVEWTSEGGPTVWLALYFAPLDGARAEDY